jgi:L-ascorbate metabolism protein UlaG (beta-lactamase superfamily)
VLFISHRHGDHADETVAQMFLDQHKPVIAPVEVWQGKPIHQAISHIRPDPHKLQEIPLMEGKPALNVVIYPGHQGENVQNNVFLVITPEGLSFGHTGDQSNIGDFAWIDHVKDHHHVDILMANCWTTDINRLARGFDAALIITGHENELGHTIDHREPYWLTYDRMRDTVYPYLLMTWGESFHYGVTDPKPER